MKNMDGSEQSLKLSYRKMEELGYDVGYRFVERLAKDRNRFVEELDIIKFLCKDIWNHIFRKQVDKLQTNHKGVYVLQDFQFKWLQQFSASTIEETNEKFLPYLVFPCGIIRGALFNLGLDATVNADKGTGNPNCPSCLFNIKVKQS